MDLPMNTATITREALSKRIPAEEVRRQANALLKFRIVIASSAKLQTQKSRPKTAFCFC